MREVPDEENFSIKLFTVQLQSTGRATTAMTIEESTEVLQLDKALETLKNVAAECRSTMTSNRSDSVECHSAVHGARQKLIVEALGFVQVVQGPVDTVQSWFDKVSWLPSFAARDELSAHL